MIFLVYMGVINMLRIAICDDSLEDLNTIKKMAENLFYSLKLEFEIEEFENGNELLDSKISFDLILLDIEMDEINGIDTAREIRKHSKDTKIIFITNSTKYLQIGYTVRADRYLVKPLNKQEFNYELSNVLNSRILDSKYILDKRIGLNKIYLRDIIYIEFYDRKTIIHTVNQKISTYITLKEWSTLLDKYYFIQSHKAFIVNVKYVKHMYADRLVLENDFELPLSRKFKDLFKQKYYTFIGDSV